jgi:hypothetical protein
MEQRRARSRRRTSGAQWLQRFRQERQGGGILKSREAQVHQGRPLQLTGGSHFRLWWAWSCQHNASDSIKNTTLCGPEVWQGHCKRVQEQGHNNADSTKVFRCCVRSLGYKCVTRCYQTVTNPCVYFEIKCTK